MPHILLTQGEVHGQRRPLLVQNCSQFLTAKAAPHIRFSIQNLTSKPQAKFHKTANSEKQDRNKLHQLARRGSKRPNTSIHFVAIIGERKSESPSTWSCKCAFHLHATLRIESSLAMHPHNKRNPPNHKAIAELPTGIEQQSLLDSQHNIGHQHSPQHYHHIPEISSLQASASRRKGLQNEATLSA
ncbi:hypothetical protein Nepgr_010439 [Nepenthes gracilis]|uniref:Uncharacterized protein n=1 Tax=Nepenthes gracilis TaxID=150966 RepID=A0AAD3SDC4_NEPGR|nr:hypothetical protein Nepgr_010439 [Nepenthes gracilis]